MSFKQIFSLGLVTTSGLIIALGCRRSMPEPSTSTTPKITLTVSAAISLQKSLEVIATQFEQEQSQIQIVYNFGSSGTLQRQIEQGAPVDIYFSASAEHMNVLDKGQQLVSHSRQNIVTNRLSLVAPKPSTMTLTALSSLTQPEVNTIAVGEFRSVPLGQYTQEVLTTLQLLIPLQSKFIFGNNARAVLTAVDSGNVAAGIVYTTDTYLSNNIQVIDQIPEQLHSQIVYPIALLQQSHHPAEAMVFIEYLGQNQAQSIFQSFGFQPISDNSLSPAPQ